MVANGFMETCYVLLSPYIVDLIYHLNYSI